MKMKFVWKWNISIFKHNFSIEDNDNQNFYFLNLLPPKWEVALTADVYEKYQPFFNEASHFMGGNRVKFKCF